MKKTLFFAAIAALFTFASCQKEETPALNQGEDLVFTATIAGQNTKTTVDASAAKVTWVLEDKITITDSSEPKVSAEYKVSAINGGRATFTKVDGQPTLGSAPYTAVYGTDPSTSQSYSESAPSLPMSASSSTTSLEFEVSCGLLELSLTAGESITSIEVTGTPTGGTETTYTLTCSTPVSIASGAKFFIALPAGSYTSFLINGQNGAQCKKSGSGLTIEENHITPVSFSKTLHFAVQLWADGPYWATTNIGATTSTDYGYYFAWGYAEGCVCNSAGDGWVLASDGTTAKQFYKTDFPFRGTDEYQDAATVNWGEGWNVPTHTDFANIFSNANIEYVKTGTMGFRATGKGDYAKNSIFLPAAGCGSESNQYDAGGGGFYWSSVIDGSIFAKYFYFNPEEEQPAIAYCYQYYGYSVRPVRSSL